MSKRVKVQLQHQQDFDSTAPVVGEFVALRCYCVCILEAFGAVLTDVCTNAPFL
jgi:hypothetical protein